MAVLARPQILHTAALPLCLHVARNPVIARVLQAALQTEDLHAQLVESLRNGLALVGAGSDADGSALAPVEVKVPSALEVSDVGDLQHEGSAQMEEIEGNAVLAAPHPDAPLVLHLAYLQLVHPLHMRS